MIQRLMPACPPRLVPGTGRGRRPLRCEKVPAWRPGLRRNRHWLVRPDGGEIPALLLAGDVLGDAEFSRLEASAQGKVMGQQLDMD